MTNTRLLLFLILLTALVTSCIPEQKEDLSDVEISLEDPIIKKIIDLQDMQRVDSLVQFLDHEDATYRYMAARAFGSIRKNQPIEKIGHLLHDPNEELRTIAAFALGQSKGAEVEDVLISGFDSNDTLRRYDRSNATILEAIGKTGSKESLNFITDISTYLPSDTVLLIGQAWAIYRFALRGIISEKGTKKMVDFLKSSIYGDRVQWIAANYLMRARDLNLKEYDSNIYTALGKHDDPRVRMALAAALGKAGTTIASRGLVQSFEVEKDYRVKCNILRALANYRYIDFRATALKAIRDKQPAVAICAADLIVKVGDSEEAIEYRNLGRDTSLIKPVRARMYQAAHSHLPFYYTISKGSINWDLRKWMDAEKDPFIQRDILNAMAEDPKNYKTILEHLDNENKLIATSAVANLVNIMKHPDLNFIIGPTKRSTLRLLRAKIKEVFKRGDAGQVAELVPILEDQDLFPKEEKEKLGYLDTVLLSLNLPEQVETFNVLNKAIAKLEGNEIPEGQKINLGHPIDWKIFDQISDSTTFAIIETSKGNIKIDFLLQEAPASVVNFVDLSQRDFYDGKYFHRVVPNFVIQGGCPRGDGYGSLNYTIRSELTPLRYDQEGYVGMASAGNHTECTQWFITHSPTPHLDGNYTIFGKVLEGMDVVHKILPGDHIIDVSIKN